MTELAEPTVEFPNLEMISIQQLFYEQIEVLEICLNRFNDRSINGNTSLNSGQTIQLNVVQLNQYLTELTTTNHS